MTFPTDPVTLAIIRSACTVDEDTGRSHLLDVLSHGERETIDDDGDTIIVGGWTPHEVIVALIDELEHERSARRAT